MTSQKTSSPVQPDSSCKTLREMSADYRASAQTVRLQLRILRRQAQTETDAGRLHNIRQSIAHHTQMLYQLNELAELTERYYDKTYRIHLKYRL